MIEEEEARARILAALSPLPREESVGLGALCGRILAEDLHAGIDLPPTDNSAVDGYALRSQDVRRAGDGSPCVLDLAGSLPAGQAPQRALAPGTALRIFTGSFLPSGADAVLMQEDAELRGRSLVVRERLRPWEHVRLRGEDVERGALLMSRGERAGARHLGVLAASGHARVRVAARPRVSVLATGRELQPPGRPLRPGAIYESNCVALEALCRQAGAEPAASGPPVADRIEDLAEALERAAGGSDAVITCGGVSVGDHDLVRPAIESLGGAIRFWRVRMQPGKPFLFAQVGDVPLFGLPGNPVSAVTVFTMLVRPALLRLQGALDTGSRRRPGTLVSGLANRGDRPHYLRVRFDGQGGVEGVGMQASHALHGLSGADGWVRVPAGGELPAGSPVSVVLLEG